MDNEKISLKNFKLLTVFGVGNYSKVALVRKNSDSRIYAMKVIKKYTRIKGVKKFHAYTERDILNILHHPFIVGFYSSFQDTKKLYYVLEYCPGGQLFGLIRRKGRLSEEICRFYAAQIFLALQYLHTQKIIYRDLKPENIVFDKDGYIRLIDFGLSQFLHQQPLIEQEKKIVGTPCFLPPETFNHNHSIGFESDWWAFGSLIFQMYLGFPPFFVQGGTVTQIFKKIKEEEPPLFLINSQPLRNFLSQLLEKDPEKRLGSKSEQEIQYHPWLMGLSWDKILRKEEKPPFIPDLESETDVRLFEDEVIGSSLSPPGSETQGEIYPSFSVSWCSKNRSSPHNNYSEQVVQIDISIDEVDKLLPIPNAIEKSC